MRWKTDKWSSEFKYFYYLTCKINAKILSILSSSALLSNMSLFHSFRPLFTFPAHFAFRRPNFWPIAHSAGDSEVLCFFVHFCKNAQRNWEEKEWKWVEVELDRRPRRGWSRKEMCGPAGRAKWTDGNILERETKDWASEKCGELVSDQPADKKEHKIIIIKSWTSRLYKEKGIMIIKMGLLYKDWMEGIYVYKKILKMR